MKLRFDIEQNTEEWVLIKLRKFSASVCADLLMDSKTKGYQGLINKIIEERITKLPCESKKFTGNQLTERGHEFEPLAREDYELRNLQKVDIIGVIEFNDWVLCSPDGLINNNGLYQAKCPIFATQKEYLKLYIKCLKENMTNNQILYKISSVYYKQIQFELFVSDRKFSIWNSFHPFLKAIDLRILRDEIMISEIENKLSVAKKEVLSEMKFLKSINI